MEITKKLIPGYSGDEWKYGYLNYSLLETDPDNTKGTCLFYNLQKEKYIKVSNIPFDSIEYFSEDILTKENLKYNTKIKFKSTVSGLDLDQIVYSTAMLIVAYGAFYERNKYLVGDTVYNYKNGGQIFISSVVVTNLNYIRYMALKNNSPEDFNKVLDALDEYIKEIESNSKELSDKDIEKFNIL